jgi:hypothetical protein
LLCHRRCARTKSCLYQATRDVQPTSKLGSAGRGVSLSEGLRQGARRSDFVQCSPQCWHIEDCYSSLQVEGGLGGASRPYYCSVIGVAAGNVGRTLSSAADAAGLGGIAGFSEGQFPSRPLVNRSRRAPSRSKCWERIRTSPSQWLRLTFDVGERRPGPVHDETIFVSGNRLCRSGVPGLSAGGQGFCQYDRHRGHELRSLAVYERASLGGDRLDLRFLDRTQLRCCGEWSITGENQYVGDSGRSRKNMRSANIANVS